MKRFSANYLFTNVSEPIRNGIVGVDEKGRVTEVIDPQGESIELESTEFYNGVIVPGFVNCHCHTELSHFRGKTTPNSGLSGFVQQIRNLRIANTDDPEAYIEKAFDEIQRSGTVAVADICNTSDSFYLKTKSSIRFFNLIEVLGLDSDKAQVIFERAKFIKDLSSFKAGDVAQLTPHSTYTLSGKLWSLLSKELVNNPLVSVHFAESKQELDFTSLRTGELSKTFKSWGLPVDSAPQGTPVDVVKRFIPQNTRLLLVHNTYLTQPEAISLKEHYPDIFFVLCPVSNLFIENALPDIEMITNLNLRIALGTDSLTSSDSLSMLDQINTIQKHFPQLPFSQTLKWASANGAEALGFNDKLGTIEPDKMPGLNLIAPFDFKNMQPLPHSKVKRLI